jgi:hypothetical protein
MNGYRVRVFLSLALLSVSPTWAATWAAELWCGRPARPGKQARGLRHKPSDYRVIASDGKSGRNGPARPAPQRPSKSIVGFPKCPLRA